MFDHPFAQAPRPAPPPAEDAASSLIASFWAEAQRVGGHLGRLTPAEIALDAGLTVAIIATALSVNWAVRRVAVTLRDRLLFRDGKRPGRGGRRIGGLTIALLDLVVFVTALVMMLRVWGIDPGRFALTPAGGALAVMIQAGFIFILAVGAIEISRFAIVHLLSNAADRSRDLRRAAQLRTLSPLLTGIAQTFIFLLAAITLLSEVGVEIAPLLAGAGVVGIAVGFGAQTLVKDFFTGAFLLMEDIVSLGDTVRIGDVTGLVEEMTLRTIRLRDFDGTLHVFPYGEAQVIHNLTKTFSYATIDLTISYPSDLEEALTLMRREGEALSQDEAYREAVLAPVQVLGVDKLSDNGVVLKARIKTRPGEQWRVGRAYNRRIKAAFDAAGVELAHRHLPVPPYGEHPPLLDDPPGRDGAGAAAPAP